MKKYTIKPLEWKGKLGEPYDTLSAKTRFGNYVIGINVDDNVPYWGYCFDEYYDEHRFEAETIEACKEAAQEHWFKTVTEVLEEVI